MQGRCLEAVAADVRSLKGDAERLQAAIDEFQQQLDRVLEGVRDTAVGLAVLQRRIDEFHNTARHRSSVTSRQVAETRHAIVVAPVEEPRTRARQRTITRPSTPRAIAVSTSPPC